jgi:GH25 family lysozyme M1 (1,4-beta-N-acetylmuramidase)
MLDFAISLNSKAIIFALTTNKYSKIESNSSLIFKYKVSAIVEKFPLPKEESTAISKKEIIDISKMLYDQDLTQLASTLIVYNIIKARQNVDRDY